MLSGFHSQKILWIRARGSTPPGEYQVMQLIRAACFYTDSVRFWTG